MWRGSEKFLDIMNEIYKNASIRGVNAHVGINTTAAKRGKKS